MKPIRNGVQVTNYVGVIQIETGLMIEVLPKIYNKSNVNTDKEAVRMLFFKMLQSVRKINGKTFQMTHLNTKKQNLFEVFIAMFLEQSGQIFKKGLSSDYVTIKSNERYLKGKLMLTEHIRINQVNASKFYNEFDEYSTNTPENQLIKKTLLLLSKISRDNKNIKLIKNQLSYLDSVDTIYEVKNTFKEVKLKRSYTYYRQVLEWCRLFLNQESFTSLKGNSFAFAILFPMERLFESYIANLTKKYLPHFEVWTQDKSYWLFDQTSDTTKEYQLKPDLMIKEDEQTMIIADTKWKVLDSRGASQSDLYQMYAYYTRYKQNLVNVTKVVLIYPYSEDYLEKEFKSLNRVNDELEAEIHIRFIDLFSPDMEQEIYRIFN